MLVLWCWNVIKFQIMRNVRVDVAAIQDMDGYIRMGHGKEKGPTIVEKVD